MIGSTWNESIELAHNAVSKNDNYEDLVVSLWLWNFVLNMHRFTSYWQYKPAPVERVARG